MFQELAINGKEREISLENKAKDILLFQLPKAPLQKGDPSKLQIKKNNFSGPEKLFFHFPFQTLLGAGTKLFRCLFQLPRAPLQRETLPNCKLKKQLFRPRKVVFSFSLPDTLGSRHEAFQVPFPAAQSATAKGDPSKLQIKKTTFQAPKSCFFIFPSRHSWEQARSFSGAFSSCPERHCKGRPFQIAN